MISPRSPFDKPSHGTMYNIGRDIAHIAHVPLVAAAEATARTVDRALVAVSDMGLSRKPDPDALQLDWPGLPEKRRKVLLRVSAFTIRKVAGAVSKTADTIAAVAVHDYADTDRPIM